MAIGNIGGQSHAVVEKWLLDATQYKTELRDMAKTIREQNKLSRDAATVQNEMAKAMGKVEASARGAEGALSRFGKMVLTGGAIYGVKRLAEVMGGAVIEGARFANMQAALPHSIARAEVATKGLVDKMTLMQAANTAAQLGLKLTSEQFSQLAESAVIQSQRMGTSAADAIQSFITGTSRMSNPILDNIGLQVNMANATARWRAETGKLTGELTTAESKMAFQNEAIRQLQEKTRGATVEVRAAGGAMAQLSVAWANLKHGASAATAETSWFGKVVGVATKVVEGWQFAISGTSPALEAARAKLAETNIEWAKTLTLMGNHASLLRDIKSGFVSMGEGMQGYARGLAETDPNVKRVGPRTAVVERQVRHQKTKAKGGKRGRQAGNEEGWDSVAGAQEEVLEAARDEQRNRNQRAEAERDAAWEREEDFRNKQFEANLRVIEAKNQDIEATRAQGKEYEDFIAGPLVGFVGGLWEAADAAIQGGDNMGLAMLKMAKSVALGIASQATVKAIFHYAEAMACGALMDLRGAAMHKAAAVLYTKTAVIAGVAGLAMSAATAAVSGGSSGSSSGAGAGGARSAEETPRKSFDTERTKSDRQKQTIVIEIANPSDPAAALMLQQRLNARIKKAA